MFQQEAQRWPLIRLKAGYAVDFRSVPENNNKKNLTNSTERSDEISNQNFASCMWFETQTRIK